MHILRSQLPYSEFLKVARPVSIPKSLGYIDRMNQVTITFYFQDADVLQDATRIDHDNPRHLVVTFTCFAFIPSTTVVGFQILSRKVNGTGLFIDDYLMLSALVRRTLFQHEVTTI